MKEIDFNAFHTSIHYQVGPFTGFKGIKKLEHWTFSGFLKR